MPRADGKPVARGKQRQPKSWGHARLRFFVPRSPVDGPETASTVETSPGGKRYYPARVRGLCALSGVEARPTQRPSVRCTVGAK